MLIVEMAETLYVRQKQALNEPVQTQVFELGSEEMEQEILLKSEMTAIGMVEMDEVLTVNWKQAGSEMGLVQAVEG